MQILNKREFYELIYGTDVENLIEKAIEAGDIADDDIDLNEEGRFIWLDSQQMGGNMGLNIEDLDKFKAAILEVKELCPSFCGNISMEEVDTAGSYCNLVIFIDIDNINPYLFTVSMDWE